MLKRVISFSLWGSSQKYCVGAVKNALLAPHVYPGWTCRFYVDFESVPHETLLSLAAAGSEIVRMDAKIPKMMTRFLVADDTTVERFLVRDADSRLSEREALAVKEWIAEDKVMHILRDHNAHQCVPGGLWGSMWRRPDWEAPAMRHLIDDWMHRNKSRLSDDYQYDQDFLITHVFGWSRLSVTIHDSNPSRRQSLGGKPFPKPRNPWPRFCGEVFDVGPNGEDVPRDGDWQQIAEDKE